MGQEKLRPYQAPPCDILNFQVTQVMKNMGFEQEKIEKAIRGKKQDTAMATYLMLNHKAPKKKGHTTTVRLFLDVESSFASSSSYLSHSIQSSGWEIKEPARPSAKGRHIHGVNVP